MPRDSDMTYAEHLGTLEQQLQDAFAVSLLAAGLASIVAILSPGQHHADQPAGLARGGTEENR